MSTRIQSIIFKHYKALENYSVSIEHVNILTGSNNSGKSTVIGALRVLAVALRAARKIKPERISLGATHCYGYRIKESLVPISLENVATNYVDGTSRISFHLTNGNTLHLNFDREAGCVLVPETRSVTLRTTADFKSQFPIGLTVIPVLGPVEHREALREIETVTSSLSTHRASRHFRNYWHHFPEGFSEFSELIESTWPGMRIQRPELNGATELNMFVTEDRIDRELYWVGFGFQIWCQLLTHLHRADPSTMIVIDEPEVYLHPEIQRKLLRVLKNTGADILVATHSTEIISEADSGEVLRIDKRKRHAERQGLVLHGTRDSLLNENSPVARKIAKQAIATRADTLESKTLHPELPSKLRDENHGAISDDPLLLDHDGWTGEVDSIPPANDIHLLNAVATTQILISKHIPVDVSHDWKEGDFGLPAVSSPILQPEDSEHSLQSHSGARVPEEAMHKAKRQEPVAMSQKTFPVSPAAFPNPASSRTPNFVSELDALLARAKSIGIKVEDHRTRGGGVYAALYGTPDEASSQLLRKLVELGLDIWPGKSYLKIDGPVSTVASSAKAKGDIAYAREQSARYLGADKMQVRENAQPEAEGVNAGGETGAKPMKDTAKVEIDAVDQSHTLNSNRGGGSNSNNGGQLAATSRTQRISPEVNGLLLQAKGLGIEVSVDSAAGNGSVWVYMSEAPDQTTRKLVWQLLDAGFTFWPGKGYQK